MYHDDPTPLLRHTFFINSTLRAACIARATLYVTGLGFFTAFVNGHRVARTATAFDPGWTSFNRTVLYTVHDVTRFINATAPVTIGIELGNGWWNPLPLRFWGSLNLRQYLAVGLPMARALLVVTTAAGAEVDVAWTEPRTWQAGDGGVRRNNVFLGEVVDGAAIADVADWSAGAVTPAANWSAAVSADSQLRVAVRHTAQTAETPPTAVLREQPAVAAWSVTDGPGHVLRVFDIGANVAAAVRLRVPGPTVRGQRVTVLYGEILFANRTVNPLMGVAGQIKHPGQGGPCAPAVAVQSDEFVCRGDTEAEVFETTLTWHGFRYAQVRVALAAAARWRASDFVARVLSIAVRDGGSFESSDGLLNAIDTMAVASVRSNLLSGVQSDCPTRERFGYGGDVFAASDAVASRFDMQRVYRKRVRDFVDAARGNGGFTETAPYNGITVGGMSCGIGDDAGPIGWGTVVPHLTRLLLQRHGDTDLARDVWPALSRWTERVLAVAEANDGAVPCALGDWSSLDHRDTNFTSLCFVLHNLDAAADIAGHIGEATSEHRWRRAADAWRRVGRLRFSNCSDSGTQCGTFGRRSQSDQAFALRYLLPTDSAERTAAVGAAVAAVDAADAHFRTGIWGTPYLLEALTASGRADLALRLMRQRDYPSFGYMLARGATSLWEVWAWSNSTYSHNHAMFAGATAWLHGLGGIRVGVGADGRPAITVAPVVLDATALAWVNTTLRTPHGVVRSAWWWSGDVCTAAVTVPANAEVVLRLPGHPTQRLAPGTHEQKC